MLAHAPFWFVSVPQRAVARRDNYSCRLLFRQGVHLARRFVLGRIPLWRFPGLLVFGEGLLWPDHDPRVWG